MGSWNTGAMYIHCGLCLTCLFHCPECGQFTFAALMPLFSLRILRQGGCQGLLADSRSVFKLKCRHWQCPLLNQHSYTLTRQGNPFLEDLTERSASVSHGVICCYASQVIVQLVYESVSQVEFWGHIMRSHWLSIPRDQSTAGKSVNSIDVCWKMTHWVTEWRLPTPC